METKKFPSTYLNVIGKRRYDKTGMNEAYQFFTIRRKLYEKK